MHYTLDDLRERIETLSIQQIKALRRSVKYLVTQYPEDKNLLEVQGILKGNLTLKQHCLFFIRKNAKSLPLDYAQLLPEELVQNVDDVLKESTIVPRRITS